MTKYRICWQSKLGGEIHRGEPLTKTEADSRAELMNARHPSIRHWVAVEDEWKGASVKTVGIPLG